MFFRTILVGLVAGLLPGLPVHAAIIGDASVSYQAERIVTVDHRSYTGKVFHVPGKERLDVNINGIPMSFILDLGDHKGEVILPALVSLAEFPLPPLLSELDRQRLEHKAVGAETVDGIPATKYRIDYLATDGNKGVGFIWLSRDNILLKIDGRIERKRHRPIVVTMHLAHLKLGPQSDSLFKPSKGLHKIPDEALQLLLNMKTKKSH